MFNAIKDWCNGVEESLQRIERQLTRIERKEREIMALSASQQAAVDELASVVGELGRDLEQIGLAISMGQQSLKDQIMALETLRDQLTADDVADATQIAALQATIEQMKASSAENDTTLVGSLQTIGAALKAMDDKVKNISVPEPAPPVTETPPPTPPETTTTP